MGLPPGPRKNRYAPLQQSAAWILSYPLIQDTVLTLDLLEGPLNSLADVYDDVEYANVDAGMLARAFTDTDENAKLMEEERFLYSYDETFPDVKFDDSEKHMLYTHIRKEGEKEIGQFTKPQSGVLRLNSRMIKDAPRGEDKQILRDARIFRSEDRAFYNWIDDNVPVETKADIQNFLKAYKKEQVRMATVNANKKGAKEKGNAKNLKRKNDQRESRKMPSPMKAMASFRSGLASISRPTTPKRPGSRGSAKKKQKKVGVKEAVLDLHTEYLETKNLIRAGVGKLRDLKQKIDNEMDGLDADIVAEVEALIKSAEDMNLSEPATVDPSADPSAAPSADPSADPSAAPSNSTKPTVDTPLYLIYKGKVLKGSAMEEVLLFDEIEEMLDEVDPAVDNPRQEAIRNTRGYKKERYGASYCWVPEGATVISSSYFTKLKKAMALKKNLDDLLDGEQCTLSRDALIVLSAFGMHNYGGSDEAMEMAIAGAWSALFKEIGYEFESKALGKACPSQRTIGRYDLNLAADCLAWMVHQIEKDGAKEVGIVTDHGHRGGQDHFVIVVIWSGLDENNRPTFRYCCPSIDSAGHTADEAARGVKTVLDRTLPEDVEVFCAMADAGGGGSIDNEYKVLKSIGVMAEDSKEANCSIHGKQKSLENPSKATMGDQGMGSRTPFQMLWVFARLMSTIRKEGGIKLLDSLWSIVQHEMMDNLEWEDHAVEQMGMAWREWLTSVQNIDEEDPEQMEKFVKFITEAPRNIQDPVWTRWASIIKTNDIFLENYATIYFLAVAIKTHYPTKKYLCKVACTLISLMNERAEPPETFDTQSIESFIDSQNIEADVPSTCNTKSTPTFYTMLLFHKAFCDYAFNDNFAFLLRDDPYYGINTFGQGSRHMAVRCYVMRKQLDELKNGGWKEKDEFTKFKEALANIPKESKHDAKRAYFGRMVEKFFGIYEENLEKHLFDRWRNNKLISYMLGSEPVLAKEFANALCHYEEQYNAMAVDEEGNATNNVIEPYANFPDEMMILEEHHTIRKGKDVVINVKEAMEWLLKICDFSKILQEDRFVKNHMKEIRELAAAEGTVRLFDLKDNEADIDSWEEAVDRSTWEGVNFMPLLEGIWRYVGIHSHHQQRCENYVQMAALIAKTLVGETRRTWRAIMLSTLMRRFNPYALLRRKEEKEDFAGSRVEGSFRIEYFLDFIRQFEKEAAEAKRELGPLKVNELRMSIMDKKKKASSRERAKLENDIQRAVKKNMTVLAAEKIKGFSSTTVMGGKILLSALKKGEGHEPLVNAELFARKITTELKEFTEEYGPMTTDEELKLVQYKEKKRMLRIDETDKNLEDNRLVTFDEMYQKTNAIVPVCDGLQEWLVPTPPGSDDEEEEKVQEDIDL